MSDKSIAVETVVDSGLCKNLVKYSIENNFTYICSFKLARPNIYFFHSLLELPLAQLKNLDTAYEIQETLSPKRLLWIGKWTCALSWAAAHKRRTPNMPRSDQRIWTFYSRGTKQQQQLGKRRRPKY